MAKKGEKHTSADGKQYVFTEGGRWREYVNGKPTQNLLPGNTFQPNSGGGGAAAAPALPPELQGPQRDLQAQVAAGLINQSQANFEMERLQGEYNKTRPTTMTNLDANSPTSAVQNEIMKGAQAGQVAGNTLTNPNQVNPFGQQTVTYDPVTGQPTVNQSLSQPNQQVLSGLQGGSVQAGQVMQGLLGGIGGMTGAGEGQPNSNLSNAIYQQLTRYTDTNFDRERDALEQRLVQTGNPVGSPKYNAQMAQLNQRYDEIRSNAGNQAVTGGMNATTQLLPTLSGVQGAGFYQPNFQGFNAVAYQQPDVQGLWNTQVGTQLSREQMDAQIKQQQIAAGATLGAAGKAAEASKYATDARSAEANQNTTPAFNIGKPPGS